MHVQAVVQKQNPINIDLNVNIWYNLSSECYVVYSHVMYLSVTYFVTSLKNFTIICLKHFHFLRVITLGSSLKL